MAIRKQAKKSRPRRAAYHHGNLRQALIDATLKLIAEKGPENATIRDAAKLAGVSPGAPFRHFPTRRALMTAVAEEALQRLRTEIAAAMEKVSSDDPLERFQALGTGYLRWAVRNPTHLRVISSRNLIDFDESSALKRDNDEIRALMAQLLSEAKRCGLLATDDVETAVLMSRAFAYGLARMFVDGHFPSWDVPDAKAEKRMAEVLDLFAATLRR